MIELQHITKTEYIEWLLRRCLLPRSIDRLVIIVRWLLLLTATASMAYLVVTGINTFLEVKKSKQIFHSSIEELRQTSDEPHSIYSENIPSNIILKANIFGPLGVKTQVPVAPVKPQTKLPLILIGTFIEKKSKPYAIIEDDKKKVQEVFNINDIVFGESKLVGIFNDRVELNRNGQIEILTLDDAPDGSTNLSPNSIEVLVDSRELETALQNLPMLLTQARAVPYFKDGKPVGLRLFSIKAGSLYEKVGLVNGDVLKTINGNSLSDMSQAMRLFEMLKQEKSINVTLERNREEKEFRYQIR